MRRRVRREERLNRFTAAICCRWSHGPLVQVSPAHGAAIAELGASLVIRADGLSGVVALGFDINARYARRRRPRPRVIACSLETS